MGTYLMLPFVRRGKHEIRPHASVQMRKGAKQFHAK
jgi:hypothetical protein